MPENGIRPLLDAIAFAERAHQGQLRKDAETPYASHVVRVCLIARQLFGVDDPRILTAAVLHDTLEDTKTDFDDLAEKFGRQVAQWVAALSKDKRLPEPQREKAYVEQLAQSPWQVKICKLADIYDNLTDALESPPERRARTVANARRYLAGLKPGLPENMQDAWKTVAKLLSDKEETR